MTTLLDDLLALPPELREEALDALDDADAEAILYDWDGTWSRPAQRMPPGAWRVWLIMAGRGFGKTRTGAEAVRRWVRDYALVNIIGATADDVRQIMVEGESGLMAICPDAERPEYKPAIRRLDWPNGARTLLFSADEPERLRGKQSMKLWMDEIASWRRPEAYDQAMLGLRLGDNPQAVVTTTPRPVRLVRELLASPTTHVTRGSTYDNARNLAPAFLEQIISKYEGTRVGRQELLAELLDDVPGALWQRKQLDDLRVKAVPDLQRVVVAIDPAATSGEDADETGIVVAGKGIDGQGYVLADRTCRLSPDGWARRAIDAYRTHKADLLVAEVNNGGEMVALTLRTVDAVVPYKAIHASRGKRTRAEPVAALYEQGKVHHVGTFPDLEDQQCVAEGTCIATLRGDVPIEQIRRGDFALTRAGWRRVTWMGCTGLRRTITIHTTTNSLVCTPNHPVWVVNRGFILSGEVQTNDIILVCQSSPSDRASSSEVSPITSILTGTTRPVEARVAASFIGLFGRLRTALFLSAGTSTTRTRIRTITSSRISSLLAAPRTSVSTASRARGREPQMHGVPPCGTTGRSEWRTTSPAGNAAWSSPPGDRGRSSVAVSVNTGIITGVTPSGRKRVFNLSVAGQPEYFANGVLTHNCNYTPDGYDGSPDRVDALVYALTELMLGSQWNWDAV